MYCVLLIVCNGIKQPGAAQAAETDPALPLRGVAPERLSYLAKVKKVADILLTEVQYW